MPASPPADPLAVVGIGCRFPGGVHDLAGFADVLRARRCVLGPVPADRWPAAVHDPAGLRPGTTVSHAGGFLPDLERFDAAAFGIADREAQLLDPRQRMLLEVAWEAMADSGRPRPAWRGSRTGVFLGLFGADYPVRWARTTGLAGVDDRYGSGTEPSFAAGRISYVFDLRGPALVVDAACSSALAAVHVAGQSLRAGEVDVALAGAASLVLSPEQSVSMSALGALSPTGRCAPFDEAADGLVRSDGCGVLVLRRLPDAIRDGDRIRAVILGSAVSHNGFSAGLTAPSAAAQADLFQAALAAAGLVPADVDYVEAHATGTPFGDPVELTALARVYGAGRDRAPLPVGSHKASFGHMNAAAGMAGLLRAVLVTGSRAVPAQAHLTVPVPFLPWPELGLVVPAEDLSVPDPGRPVRAAVTALGLTGANAHLIVEQPPDPAATAAPAGGTAQPAAGDAVLVAGATSEQALREHAGRLQAAIAAVPPEQLPGLLAAAAHRPALGGHRMAVLAGDRAELLLALRRFAAGDSPDCVRYAETGPDQPPGPARAAGEPAERLVRRYLAGADVDWTPLLGPRPAAPAPLPPQTWGGGRYPLPPPLSC